MLALQVLDDCTPLLVQDVTSRARPAVYTWSSTDAALQELISGITGPIIEVSNVTSLQSDITITVQVTVRDFFGLTSLPNVFSLTKMSTPVPEVCILCLLCALGNTNLQRESFKFSK
jgi:hypothetical protein